jgi:hypothetical protein
MAYKYSKTKKLDLGTGVGVNHVTTTVLSSSVLSTQSTILNRLNTSSSYVLQYTHHFIGVDTVNATSSITITLPSASGSTAGRSYVIKDEGGAADINNIIIQASGSNTVDGFNAVYIESPYASMNVYTDGVSKWFIY